MPTDEVKDFLISITDTDSLKKSGFYPISIWGKDHWSLLGYLFSIAANNQDTIDYNKTRVNNLKRVPIGRTHFSKWEETYGTRLKGFWYTDSENKTQNNYKFMDKDHDDVDCLHDMEAEGVIVLGTYVSGFFKLTDKGMKLGLELMAFKNAGGQFASFSPKE